MSHRILVTRMMLVLLGVATACGHRSPCPAGAHESVIDGGTYCTLPFSGVIIAGFDCPPEYPYRSELSGGVVCSDVPLDPRNVPEDVCDALGGDCGVIIDPPPLLGRWAELPPPGLARAGGACAWTDLGLLVLGGETGRRYASVATDDVRLLDASRSSWRPLMEGSAPRSGPLVAAGGGSALAFGSTASDPPELVARELDLATETWRDVSTGAPSVRGGTLPVYESGRFVVFGGMLRHALGSLGDGATLDPVSGVWREVSLLGAPSPRSDALIAGDGQGHVFVFGGGDGPVAGTTGDGALLDLASGAWRPLPSGGAPTPRRRAVGGWTTAGLVVWGGTAPTGLPLRDGALLAPGAERWTPMTAEGALPAATMPVGVIVGDRLVVLSGVQGSGRPLEVRAYDAISEAWVPLPLGPATRERPCVASTGSTLLVSGGISADATYLDDAWEWTP